VAEKLNPFISFLLQTVVGTVHIFIFALLFPSWLFSYFERKLKIDFLVANYKFVLFLSAPIVSDNL